MASDYADVDDDGVGIVLVMCQMISAMDGFLNAQARTRRSSWMTITAMMMTR